MSCYFIQHLACREHFKFDEIIFVDGGGDSLILEPADANDGSEYDIIKEMLY